MIDYDRGLLLAGGITFCGDPLGSPCKKRTIGGFGMSEVKRYDMSGYGDGMIERDDGAFVHIDDHKSELAALREELTKANDKIDQAWNRKSCVDYKGFIPGALDAWKRPVPQDLPYDFSGNPGASATQYCNGWNDSGGYWSAHANELQQRLTAAEQRNADDLRDANRYRWIRSQTVGHCEIQRTLFETISDDCNPPYRSLKYGKDLDDAIDAQVKPTESGASE